MTNSNAMEREGFKRCMENIQGKGAKVKVVATDRHASIKSDMKQIYPNIDHQFDVWHLAKSVTKKLTEKAKKKDCGNLTTHVGNKKGNPQQEDGFHLISLAYEISVPHIIRHIIPLTHITGPQ